MLYKFKEEVFEKMISEGTDIGALPSSVKSWVSDTITAHYQKNIPAEKTAKDIDVVVIGMLRVNYLSPIAFSD